MSPESSPWRITSHSSFGEFGTPVGWERMPQVGAPPQLTLRAVVWRFIFAALIPFWAAVILLVWSVLA